MLPSPLCIRRSSRATTHAQFAACRRRAKGTVLTRWRPRISRRAPASLRRSCRKGASVPEHKGGGLMSKHDERRRAFLVALGAGAAATPALVPDALAKSNHQHHAAADAPAAARPANVAGAIA